METSTLLSPRQFADFSALITERLGIRLPEGKRLMLHNRLARRAQALGLSHVGEYHDWFFGGGQGRDDELQHLLDAATTNKTAFFREPAHFEMLTEIARTWRRSAACGEPFRVWCAGCATGEEAYTLGMVLLDSRAAGGPEFSILATDVCMRALAHAQHAVYEDDLAEPVPAGPRNRYLLRPRDPSRRVVRVAPEVRGRVRFGHLNFLAGAYGLPEVFDVVFFRNVMIYFDRETQRAVLARICAHLKVGGYLFVGHAETASGHGLPLTAFRSSVFRREEGTP